MSKMAISPCVFLNFFEVLIFWAVRGGGGGGVKGKNSPKGKITITSVMCLISGRVKHVIMIFGTIVLNADISRCFFIFLKFSFFRQLQGKRARNSPK